MKTVVVGATGMLGSEICRLLVAQGTDTRVVVRGTSNPDALARLRGLGVEMTRGDLKDAVSLEAACDGATAVISTASSTLSRQEGDSIESVDRRGQLNLIDAAEKAGVRHFVLISFPAIDIDFPLQSAKREVEERLRRGSTAAAAPRSAGFRTRMSRNLRSPHWATTGLRKRSSNWAVPMH